MNKGQNFNIIYFLIFPIIFSCNSPRSIFGKTTAHAAYAHSLASAGLQTSALGRQWQEAATRALTAPVKITMPYQEKGFFAASNPSAAGLLLDALQGEEIIVDLKTNPASGLKVFLEIWSAPAGEQPQLAIAGDTLTHHLTWKVRKTGKFILRLQPELLRDVEYNVTVRTGPSLAFPVPLKNNPKVQSFWGAGRDGGARSHEGIDISAAHRTPVVAAADGVVGRVTDNNLGGKVVFLRTEDGYSLYYAHLDEQLVQPGDRLTIGDTLGLMGNTGNARGGASHLHFGIYTSGGAVDPYPFVRINRPEPPVVKASMDQLGKNLRVKEKSSSRPSESNVLEKDQLVKVTAAFDNAFRVVLPLGKEEIVPALNLSSQKMKSQKLMQSVLLYSAPVAGAPVIKTILAGQHIDVLGKNGTYLFITADGVQGWITGI